MVRVIRELWPTEQHGIARPSLIGRKMQLGFNHSNSCRIDKDAGATAFLDDLRIAAFREAHLIRRFGA